MTDMLPTPRFQIGQTVWLPRAERTVRKLDCPDCKGTRTWTVVTPAGTKMTTPCQRCADRHATLRSPAGKYIPSVEIVDFKPFVKRMTIGSVRIDTAAEPAERVSYMCLETGIGTGSVYKERQLYQSEREAMEAALAMCAAQREDSDNTPEMFAARHLAKMTVTAAFRTADWKSVYDAWDVARHLRKSIDTIIEDTDHDLTDRQQIVDFLEMRLDELRRYSFIDRHPFEELMRAAQASTDPAMRQIADALHCKFPSGDDEPTKPETDVPYE